MQDPVLDIFISIPNINAIMTVIRLSKMSDNCVQMIPILFSWRFFALLVYLTDQRVTFHNSVKHAFVKIEFLIVYKSRLILFHERSTHFESFNVDYEIFRDINEKCALNGFSFVDDL